MSKVPAGGSRLRYDALNRWTAVSVDGQPAVQRFFQARDRLTTQLQEGQQYAVLQHGEQVLALLQKDAVDNRAMLLATDQQQSPLTALSAEALQVNRYSPYGHASLPVQPHLLGFNGELAEPLSRHYLLGSYRLYNSYLMRFVSPDSWSPFGKGGLNPYAYCGGDPINRHDPTGHNPLLKALKLLKAGKNAPGKAASASAKPLNFAQDIKEIYPGVKRFVDKGGKRLNLVGHGKPGNGKSTVMMTSTGESKDGYEVGLDLLSDPTIDLSKVSKVRTLMCHSAEGGEYSFAAALAETTGLPTRGFHGRVGTLETVYQDVPAASGKHVESRSTFDYFDDVHPHRSELFLPTREIRQ